MANVLYEDVIQSKSSALQHNSSKDATPGLSDNNFKVREFQNIEDLYAVVNKPKKVKVILCT